MLQILQLSLLYLTPNECPVPHLVPGLGLKSSYQFTFLLSLSSHQLWPLPTDAAPHQYRTLVRAVVQALLDQPNQRVVPTELAHWAYSPRRCSSVRVQQSLLKVISGFPPTWRQLQEKRCRYWNHSTSLVDVEGEMASVSCCHSQLF